MRTRFVAEWIIDMDDNGTDKEAARILPTFEEAMHTAIREGKKVGVIEWWRVREQQLTPCNDGGPPYWSTVCRWNGDWDGNYDETRC